MRDDSKELASHFITEIEIHMKADDFQRDFFESLNDQFQKRGHLTVPQLAALQRIYERVTS